MLKTTNVQAVAKYATEGNRRMKRARKTRAALLKQYATRFYHNAPEEGGLAEPVNLIYQAANTLIPNLVSRDPKASISSRFVAYRDYAMLLELGVNHLAEEIKLATTLREVLFDAIFCAGFVKIGIDSTGAFWEWEGVMHEVDQPYVDRVDPDDMIIDPLGRNWYHQMIIGNRYDVDLDILKDSGRYDPDLLEKLSSRYDAMSSDDVALIGEHRGFNDYYNLAHTATFVDLYIPAEQRIMTMPWAPDGEIEPILLRETDYEGPEEGPYKILGFSMLSDNILPVPPAYAWKDLHDMTNKIVRKAVRQAERQKSVLAYTPSSISDAQHVVDADDGEAVAANDIDNLKEVSYGGVNDGIYQYIAWAKQQFSEMAMNIDVLSGAGSDEATATQAEMVQANTSVRLGDMQNMVYDFTGEIMTHLAFYLHTDPLIEPLPLVKRQGGIETQVFYTPEMREGEWMDYNVRVRPFSMARQDPNLQLRRLLELYATVIPALAQAYMSIGPGLNLDGALNVVLRKMGIEEADEIVNSPVLQQQNMLMQQLMAMGIPMSPKVVQTLMPGGMGNLGALGGPARAQEPNPSAMLPMNVTPGTERNQMRQETAGELQATY